MTHPVDDTFEMSLKYPNCKIPGMPHLFVHLETKHDPHHTTLSHIYQAIYCVTTHRKGIQTRRTDCFRDQSLSCCERTAKVKLK